MRAPMRTTLAAALLLAAALPSLAADPEVIAVTPELVEAAKKDGQLTLLYSSPLLTMQAYAADFNKAYPDIKVNLERKAGSAGAQALLQEFSAGVNRIDLFEGSDQGANPDLIAKGMFAAIRPANADDFETAALHHAPYLYFSDYIRSVIAYNPKIISDDLAKRLKNWSAILEPEFKGKFSISEPTFGVTLTPLLYMMSHPEMGENFYRKLRETQPRIFLNTPQARDALMSGQTPISWAAQWDAVILTDIARGRPVRFVFPEPTPRWGTGAWGVLAKAQHPNAARLFFAWKMSKDGAASAQSPASNTRSFLKDFPDTREAMKTVTSESWYEPPKTFWTPSLDDWARKGPQYQKVWEDIMRKGG